MKMDLSWEGEDSITMGSGRSTRKRKWKAGHPQPKAAVIPQGPFHHEDGKSVPIRSSIGSWP